MAKATNNYDQDAYDKAFINVLTELQGLGFCKNVLQLEKHLEFPKGTLYETLKGRRGIPRLRRPVLQQFFALNYNVNPRYWINPGAPMFKGDGPPVLEEVEETYITRSETDTRWTIGDANELRRLRDEVKTKDEQIKELKKEVKYWRDLAQRLLPAAANDGPKTGQKTGQKGGKK